MIPFVTDHDPQYGTLVQVSPLIQRVTAGNPSKFTWLGTGTYVVGQPDGPTVVIDPGPQLDSHRQALTEALRGRDVVAIAVTHCHSDHSPLAAWLRERTGAPTVAFGPHHTPPSADLADHSPVDATDRDMGDGIDVEEAVDRDFVPDISLADGDVAASGDGWTLTAVHTPGHAANHLCFALDAESALFTGDHVMGWSTTVIAPPDGNMAEYLASLRLVAARHDRTLWPTHGAPVREPTSFVEALIDHRLAREQAVLDAVADGLRTIDQIVARLYADVRPELHKPAGFSVLAHLESLVADGLVVTEGRPRRRGEFSAAR